MAVISDEPSSQSRRLEKGDLTGVSRVSGKSQFISLTAIGQANASICAQDTAQVRFIEDDNLVQALTSDRADESFNVPFYRGPLLSCRPASRPAWLRPPPSKACYRCNLENYACSELLRV